MLAQKCGAQIDAVDIDEVAVHEARDNAAASPWSERIRVLHNSLQEFAASTDEQYDLIVSNPPYFSESVTAAEKARAAARH
jgi:tRNA1Val (adenine37-N6)-methyltransferase